MQNLSKKQSDKKQHKLFQRLSVSDIVTPKCKFWALGMYLGQR